MQIFNRNFLLVASVAMVSSAIATAADSLDKAKFEALGIKKVAKLVYGTYVAEAVPRECPPISDISALLSGDYATMDGPSKLISADFIAETYIIMNKDKAGIMDSNYSAHAEKLLMGENVGKLSKDSLIKSLGATGKAVFESATFGGPVKGDVTYNVLFDGQDSKTTRTFVLNSVGLKDAAFSKFSGVCKTMDGVTYQVLRYMWTDENGKYSRPGRLIAKSHSLSTKPEERTVEFYFNKDVTACQMVSIDGVMFNRENK